MTKPLNWMHAELDELRREGLVRNRRMVTSLPDGWAVISGRKLKNFAANDYLNLAHDPRVIAAATAALAEGGASASASALITGRTRWHVALEERLAAFEAQPQALLFPTGFAANLGTVSALAGAGDAVFCDRLNHASLVDGCRLSGARLRVYRHHDLEGLRRELHKGTDFRRRLIVTDTLFSMDGDAAPLVDLCDIAEHFECVLVIDEAHATGVFGSCGRGLAELAGAEQRITVRVGTLSKAIGSMGGFVTGSADLIEWLWNRARPGMFSTALPPACCAAALASLQIIEDEPWRRERVLELSAELRTQLGRSGVATPEGVVGPIIPVILNSPELATHVAAQLEDRGFLVAAIRPPTVPRGTSRLRITLNCSQTIADLRGLADALSEVLASNPP